MRTRSIRCSMRATRSRVPARSRRCGRRSPAVSVPTSVEGIVARWRPSSGAGRAGPRAFCATLAAARRRRSKVTCRHVRLARRARSRRHARPGLRLACRFMARPRLLRRRACRAHRSRPGAQVAARPARGRERGLGRCLFRTARMARSCNSPRVARCKRCAERLHGVAILSASRCGRRAPAAVGAAAQATAIHGRIIAGAAHGRARRASDGRGPPCPFHWARWRCARRRACKISGPPHRLWRSEALDWRGRAPRCSRLRLQAGKPDATGTRGGGRHGEVEINAADGPRGPAGERDVVSRRRHCRGGVFFLAGAARRPGGA